MIAFLKNSANFVFKSVLCSYEFQKYFSNASKSNKQSRRHSEKDFFENSAQPHGIRYFGEVTRLDNYTGIKQFLATEKSLRAVFLRGTGVNLIDKKFNNNDD